MVFEVQAEEAKCCCDWRAVLCLDEVRSYKGRTVLLIEVACPIAVSQAR